MSDIPHGFRPDLSDSYREALFAQVQRIEDSARRLREAATSINQDAAQALAYSMDAPLDQVDLGTEAIALRVAVEREAGFMEADARTLRGLLQIV